jgi:hypothetical protein
VIGQEGKHGDDGGGDMPHSSDEETEERLRGRHNEDNNDARGIDM